MARGSRHFASVSRGRHALKVSQREGGERQWDTVDQRLQNQAAGRGYPGLHAQEPGPANGASYWVLRAGLRTKLQQRVGRVVSCPRPVQVRLLLKRRLTA